MIQEAAFTELINKRSLEQLEKLENERVNELTERKSKFAPDEQIISFKQTTKGGVFQSTYTFPSAEQYPKNFNTKISKKDGLKYQEITCPITGKPARYKDPLTQQPYATKEAFKIIREKYFSKEEEKLFVRLQVLNDLLAQKRDKLRRYHQGNRNLDLQDPMRQIILKNLAASQNVKKSYNQGNQQEEQGNLSAQPLQENNEVVDVVQGEQTELKQIQEEEESQKGQVVEEEEIVDGSKNLQQE